MAAAPAAWLRLYRWLLFGAQFRIPVWHYEPIQSFTFNTVTPLIVAIIETQNKNMRW